MSRMLIDSICSAGHVNVDVWRVDGECPPCRECGGETVRCWQQSPSAVIGDDIPGGIMIRHGLCNADGTPRRYNTKSEIRREAAARGLLISPTHAPPPGSDGNSKSSSRWV